MKTINLNGSPKGNSNKCNSKIIAEHFIKNMKNPCEIKCIAGNDPQKLVEWVSKYDTMIIILPLYIHAMPGIVMKFIEVLQPACSDNKHIGFIVQAGFIETAQHKYIHPYFQNLAKQLNYNYLGTVSKGEAAAIYMFPIMFRKVLKMVAKLGQAFEETNSFDPEIVKILSKPYELSKSKLRLLNFVSKIGLDNIGWNRMQKKNKAYHRRLDKPYLR